MSGRDGRTRLDDHLQRLVLLEQIIESILLRVLDPDGSGHQLTCIAHDGDHRIRCVSIDSCDKHGYTGNTGGMLHPDGCGSRSAGFTCHDIYHTAEG